MDLFQVNQLCKAILLLAKAVIVASPTDSENKEAEKKKLITELNKEMK